MTLECRYCKRTLQRSSWGKYVESKRHQTKEKEAKEEGKEKWLSRNSGRGELDYRKYQWQCKCGIINVQTVRMSLRMSLLNNYEYDLSFLKTFFLPII